MSVTVSRPTRRTGHFDSLEQEVYLNMWRTYDRLRMLEDELFQEFELTAQQYNALRLLQAAAPAGLQTLQLASKLVSRAPDITRMLDKLEERGLIQRTRRSDNRRVVEVALTAAGLTLLQKIREPLQSCHSRQLGHLSATQLKQLSMLLKAARGPHESEDSPWK